MMPVYNKDNYECTFQLAGKEKSGWILSTFYSPNGIQYYEVKRGGRVYFRKASEVKIIKEC
jgi:hypothetical protein